MFLFLSFFMFFNLYPQWGIGTKANAANQTNSVIGGKGIEYKIKDTFNKMNGYTSKYKRKYLEEIAASSNPAEYRTKYSAEYRIYKDILFSKKDYLPQDIFAIFTVEEIKKYKLLHGIMGCTGDSRMFVHLMKKHYPEVPVRLVMTVVKSDYLTVCKGKLKIESNAHMNGHQVVLVKFKSEWRLIDTSVYNNITYATWVNGTNKDKVVAVSTPEELVSTSKEIKEINFNNENDPYLITAQLDEGGVYKMQTLMNYYASGSSDSGTCKWPTK